MVWHSIPKLGPTADTLRAELDRLIAETLAKARAPKSFRQTALEYAQHLERQSYYLSLYGLGLPAAPEPKEDPNMQRVRSMPYAEYVGEVRRTLAPATDRERKLTLALGLVNETVEFLQALSESGIPTVVHADPANGFYFRDSVKPSAISAAVELKLVNELGDLLWYTVALTDAYGLSLLDVHAQSFHVPGDAYVWDYSRLLYAVKDLGEYVKKNVAHGHADDPAKLRTLLHTVAYRIAHTSTAFRLTEDTGQIATINVAKLRKRYPEGFEASRSEVREPMERLIPDQPCPAYTEFPLNPGVCRLCGFRDTEHTEPSP